MGTMAVPSSTRSVHRPASASTDMASRYPGTCGNQNEAKPWPSAVCAAVQQPRQAFGGRAILIGAHHQALSAQAGSRHMAVPFVRDDRMERRGEKRLTPSFPSAARRGPQPHRRGHRIVVQEAVGQQPARRRGGQSLVDATATRRTRPRPRPRRRPAPPAPRRPAQSAGMRPGSVATAGRRPRP